MPQTQAICVVIAARNASTTIERAVASALAEPETAEVVVIDDGSTDATSTAAQTADDGSGRLRILRFERNRGPAAARNAAIACSSSPFIAILDADDFFLPGRFGRLLAEDGWDFVADNIAFIEESRVTGTPPTIPDFHPQPRMIDLESFIEGNISRRGVRRGEIGFLKPVMRRAFLESNDLRYREDLRLGEDYELYARALAKGARYRLIHACGYCAVVRSDSLSGRHRTEDLRRLYEADRAILADSSLSGGMVAVIRRHERHVRAKYDLRRFLDLKRDEGAFAALRYAFARPAALPAIAGGILADKTEQFRRPPGIGAAGHRDSPGLRYLLSAVPVSAQR
ncbi:glycosyltransferase family 2 protein [Ciceribacter azotifigens]|uniref:glycosyltransferase family 2 protein n=1 Tax=Ciceribacter azotifigens TaxID=2069303 RepID=UPI003A8852FC